MLMSVFFAAVRHVQEDMVGMTLELYPAVQFPAHHPVRRLHRSPPIRQSHFRTSKTYTDSRDVLLIFHAHVDILETASRKQRNTLGGMDRFAEDS